MPSPKLPPRVNAHQSIIAHMVITLAKVPSLANQMAQMHVDLASAQSRRISIISSLVIRLAVSQCRPLLLPTGKIIRTV